MKKYKLYSLAAAATLTLGLSSCGEGFLTEEPASSVSIDGYYTTDARIMESAVAAYDPMHWYDYFSGWCPINLMWDIQADDMYAGGSNKDDQGYLYLISRYDSDPNNTIGGFWSANYSGINRSIRLIDNATASDLPEADKNLYIAEGRALRAWYYLCLWRTWGNIPFYMENLTFPYIAEQKSADEVYEAIVIDLEGVIDMNILPMKQPDEWAGRMTQAAVYMMYAELVMYQKDQTRYQKALNYMKEIINSTQYDLVDGADYDQLFSYTTEWTKEIILDINYASKGSSRDCGSANAPGGTVFPTMIGVAGLNYNGTNIGTIDGPYAEFSIGGYGFGTVSKEAYDAFEEGDLRRDVAILNIYKYIEDMAARGIKVTYAGRFQNTGYFLRKYLGRPGGNEGATASTDLGWDNNLHIYRFAETLLNAAELGLALGDADAQRYFDRVRTRAGLATKPLTIDNLIDERRVEFVGEGKRYFDLVRTDKAASVLTAGGGVILQSGGALNETTGLQDTDNMVWSGQAIDDRPNWTANKKYLPIPQSEIEAAQGTITQNEYW